MTELAIRGLSKHFGDVAAVDGFELEIGDHELISLLGPSGCGKTTTLRCIAGFEEPTAGHILFDDRDIVGLPPERRNIGMVFQNYALFPHMTVRQNLAFGLEMRGVSKSEMAERIAGVLETVQLGDLGERYPRQLSGGQQQRIALARAMVIEPSILLLDEPLANLDAKLREEMRFFVRSLQKRVGITTVYVTHDQAEAMVISDRIVVMFDGHIHQVGSHRTRSTRGPSAARWRASSVSRTSSKAGSAAPATTENAASKRRWAPSGAHTRRTSPRAGRSPSSCAPKPFRFRGRLPPNPRATPSRDG